MIKYCCFITLFFQFSFSQKNNEIKIIVEGNNCIYCDCYILNNEDIIFYKKTDVNGLFSLSDSIYNSFTSIKVELGNGANCIVKKEKKMTNYVFLCSKNEINLKSNTLEEVVIFTTKNIIQDEGDKLIYNVDKELTNTTGSSLDILRKTPMISVDMNGVPSIRGNNNVLIMINNRVISGLTSSQIIEQIPSSQISKIEVITTPSAKYEAEGSSGIINIMTKRKINFKSSGYLNIGLGNKGSHLLSNYIYKINDKWSLSNFLNSLFYYPKSESIQIYKSENINFDKKSNGNTDGKIYSYQMAISRSDDKSKLDINLNYYKQSEESDESYFLNGSDSIYNSNILERYSFFKLNSDYENKISEKFKLNFTHSISFLPVKNNSTANLLYSESESSILTNTFAIDLESKITKRLSSEFGVKLTNNYYKSNSKNIFNEFTFNAKQLLFATYLDNKYKINNKINLNFGLRFENFSFDDNKTILKEYANIFYNGNVNIKLNNKTSLSFLYGQRTQRPSYSNLLPIRSYTSSNLIVEGNPNLNQELSYNYEISFSKHIGNNFIKISPYYKFIKNKISNYITNDNDKLFTNYINLKNEKDFGISSWFTLNLLNKKLSLNYGLDVINKTLEYNNDTKKGTLIINSLNLTYTIAENLYFNLFGNFNSPNIFLQGTENVFTFSNLSLQKDFKKGDIKMGISVDNPFNKGFKYTQNYEFEKATFSNEILYLNRGIRLLFIYKFGKNKNSNNEPINRDNILKNNN